jgi:hypothetical protein
MRAGRFPEKALAWMVEWYPMVSWQCKKPRCLAGADYVHHAFEVRFFCFCSKAGLQRAAFFSV